MRHEQVLLSIEKDGGHPKNWNRMGRNLIRFIRNETNGWEKQGMYKETMKGLQDARVMFSMTEYRKTSPKVGGWSGEGL